jgi:hypothetical protein
MIFLIIHFLFSFGNNFFEIFRNITASAKLTRPNRPGPSRLVDC